MKTAARPIRLNRTDVGKAIGRLARGLQRVSRGKENEPVGNHSEPIVKTEIEVEKVSGESAIVKILLLSKISRTSPSIISGGFGRLKSTGQPIIIVTLNGALPWSQFNDVDLLKREMTPVLMHELTHAADWGPPSLNKVQKLSPTVEDLGTSYYNEPKEVRAFMREIYEEIRSEVLQVADNESLWDEWGLGKTLKLMLDFSPTWKDISPHLNEKNRKLILKGLVRATQDDLGKQGRVASNSPENPLSEMNHRKSAAKGWATTPISQDFVAGLRKWINKTFVLKPKYSSLGEMSEHLRTLYEEVEKLSAYLRYNKGFLPDYDQTDPGFIETWKREVLKHVPPALDVVANEIVYVEDLRDRMTPGTTAYKMDQRNGYRIVDVYQRFDSKNPQKAAVEMIRGQIEGGLKKARNILSNRLLRSITRMLNDMNDGHAIEWPEILLEYNIGNVKLVYDASTFRKSKPADPRRLSEYIPFLKKAKALLDIKGFGNLWYGPIFVSCAECGGTSYLGKDLRVAGNYYMMQDFIEIFVTPKPFVVDLIIHEMGHRYYYKVMTREDRLRFDSFFKEVMAVSKYGGTATEEDFAEVFSHYITGKDLTRDQIERFRAFLAKKDRNRVASDRSDKEKDEIYQKWDKLVNMSPSELSAWAKDDDRLEASLSRDEADGIQSGYDSLHRIKRRIKKPRDKWTNDDYDNAAQENGFNSRMIGNKPGDPVGDTGMSKWEISLRNWGHDPSKKSSPAHSKWKAWKGRNKEGGFF